jgi:hypothetical protein
MDISTDGNGGTDGLDIALFNEELLDLLTEETEVTFGKNSLVLDSL